MPFKNILTKKIGQIVHEVIRIIALSGKEKERKYNLDWV